MSTAVKSPTAVDAPAIPARSPELQDDPATSEEAWNSWLKHLVIAVLVALPVLTVVVGGVLAAITDVDTAGAFVIAGWASFWACVFVGGAVGTTVYETRREHH